MKQIKLFSIILLIGSLLIFSGCIPKLNSEDSKNSAMSNLDLMECGSKAKISILELGGSESICYDSENQQIKFHMLNSGSRAIKEISVNFVGSNLDTKNKHIVDIDRTNYFEIKTDYPNKDGTGPAFFDIVPSILSNGDKLIMCESAKLSFEMMAIKNC